MRKLFLFAALLLTVSLSAQSLNTPAGSWKTVDEEGNAKSVVAISDNGNGVFTGKIVKLLSASADAVCENCSGKQKNAPIVGLTIIKDLKAKKDHWAGGTILDPTKGAEYKLSIWYEDDNPDVLFVRGKHWTGLYRTQQWVRAN